MARRTYWQDSDSISRLAVSLAFITVLVTTTVLLVGRDTRISSLLKNIALFGDPDRVWLIALWLLVAGSIVFALAFESRLRRSALPRSEQFPLRILSWMGLACVIVSFVWRNGAYGELWVGFGPVRGVIALVTSVVVLVLTSNIRRAANPLLVLSLAAAAAALGLFLFETPGSFLISYDNAFTFEEILAPSSGRMPGFDYVNQYSSLLGYPLALVAALTSHIFARSPQTYAIVWMILLQVATFVFAIAATVRLAPIRIRWLMPIIVISITFLMGADGLLYYADIPLRSLLPVVALFAIAFMGERLRPTLFAVVLGVLGGAAAFNNLDFGIPALLASGVVALSASKTWRAALLNALLYLLGAIVVPGVLVTVAAASGRSLHLSYILFFVQSFGVDGLMNEPIPLFGLHAGYVILGVIGAVIGAVGTRRLTRANRVLHQALLFQSVWLVLSLAYFSGRSLTPTLVTGSSLLASVVVALLVSSGFSAVIGSRRLSFRSLLAKIRSSARFSNGWIAAALLIVAVAIPIAALTYLPHPSQLIAKFQRVADPVANAYVYLAPDPRSAIASLSSTKDLIGILSVSGSTWGPMLGISNASLFLHPNYLVLGDAASMQCDYLSALPGRDLLITDNQAAVLNESADCKKQFDFDGATVLSHDPVYNVNWVLLPRT